MPLTIGVVPLVDRVVTVRGSAVDAAVDQVVPPSVEYWYEVTGLPPSEPAVKVRERDPSARAVAVTTGWSGTVAGVPATAADADDSPMALSARTWMSYVVPFVSPGMTNVGDDDPVGVHGPASTE